jgi:GAF domain-containing protein
MPPEPDDLASELTDEMIEAARAEFFPGDWQLMDFTEIATTIWVAIERVRRFRA